MSTKAQLHRQRTVRVARALDSALPPWGNWAQRLEDLEMYTLKRADMAIHYNMGPVRVLEILKELP